MTNEIDEVLPFTDTREHRRFIEFCNACIRHSYIGVCYGFPGVGKTLSASRYANWEIIEETMNAECSPDKARPVPRTLLECRTVFYTPPVVTSPSRLERTVSSLRTLLTGLQHQARDRYTVASRADDNVRDFTRLIIVDEADRLNVPSLEQVREIYDRGKLAVILIGIPGIEKKLSRYAQLYSRVGFVHQFRNLSGDELRSVIAESWRRLGIGEPGLADEEAMATIIRSSKGNFRLIQRLFSQIARVLEINALHVITNEVVLVARESLIIGPTD